MDTEHTLTVPSSTFTDAQKWVIAHRNGPLLVLAGPGSGKTTVLTNRVLAMTEEGGIPPEHILVITFTKAAAEEMEGRFEKMTEGRTTAVTFGTMHSVFLKVLTEEGMGQFSLLERSWQLQLLGNAVENLNRTLDTADKIALEPEIIDRIIGYISCRKNRAPVTKDLAEQLGLTEENLDTLYREYVKSCRQQGKIDYDDMLLVSLELLEKSPSIRKKWQNRYRYILVDEVQDCNPIQQELILLLAGEEKNVMLVGDDDQSLYRFRGAGPEWMCSFQEHFPEGKTICLEENFRSGTIILQHAQKLISHNQIRLKKLQRAASLQNGLVSYAVYENEEEQAEAISAAIERHYGESGRYGDCAVLVRSRSEMGCMLKAFTDHGLPVYAPGHKKRSRLSEAKEDIIAYAKAALGEADRAEWMRIINRPYRNIDREWLLDGDIEDLFKHRYPGAQVVAAIRQKMLQFGRIQPDDMGDLAICRLKEHMFVLQRLRPYAAICYIRKAIGYDILFAKEIAGTGNPGQILRDLDAWMEEAKKQTSLISWSREMYAELQEDEERLGDRDAISLLTYHAAKGLEFSCVYLPDVNEGLIPHKRSIDAEDLEEERRMFYVAMTRAKSELNISYVKQYRKKRIGISRFIAESR